MRASPRLEWNSNGLHAFSRMGSNSPLHLPLSGSPLLRSGDRFRIEDVYPRIDEGRFPVKRVVGEPVEVWANIYRDGHDVLAAALIWRRETDREWRSEPMQFASNDRWGGSFTPHAAGRYEYAIEAWTDDFATWRHGISLKIKDGSAVDLDAMEGADLLTKAKRGSQEALAVIARSLDKFVQSGNLTHLLSDELAAAMASGREAGPHAIAAPSSRRRSTQGPLRRLVRNGSS